MLSRSMTIFTVMVGAFAAEPYFSREEALNACASAVLDQARVRYRTNTVQLLDANFDDRSGRPDWIVGVLAPHRPGIYDPLVGFACVLDAATRQIRSTQLDPIFPERRHAEAVAAAIENCRREVSQRAVDAGYIKLKFHGIYSDDRPGRLGSIGGSFSAAGPWGIKPIYFSCTADPDTGHIRSLDLSASR